MKSLLIGLIILAAAVYAVLPSGLGWGGDVLLFLRGCSPVVAFLAGAIVLFVGFADIKDRQEAKKEEEKEKAE